MELDTFGQCRGEYQFVFVVFVAVSEFEVSVVETVQVPIHNQFMRAHLDDVACKESVEIQCIDSECLSYSHFRSLVEGLLRGILPLHQSDEHDNC